MACSDRQVVADFHQTLMEVSLEKAVGWFCNHGQA